MTTRDVPEPGAAEPSTASSMRPAAGPDAPPGETGELFPLVPGRYRVLGVLGRGGQSVVHRALDVAIGREVAIKELLPADQCEEPSPSGSPRSATARARFLREARITGRLAHPNIVTVHEVGVKPDGTPYCVQEMARGRTLKQALAGCATARDRLALIAHFLDACHAIAHAHSQGIVHRDVKPSNIMLGERGQTVVVDWGLARSLASSERLATDAGEAAGPPLPDVTLLGDVLGTPSYMSPEQSRGDVARVREASDVWSLGAVLHEILAGHPPRRGADGRVPPVRASCPEAPAELAAIAMRALEDDPASRYADAGEMARDLEAFRDGRFVAAHRYTSWELTRRLIGRHRALAFTIAAALVVAAALLALAVRGWTDAHRNLALAHLEVARRAEQDRDFGAADVALARAHGLVPSPRTRWGLALLATRGLLPGFDVPGPIGIPVSTVAVGPAEDLFAVVDEDGRLLVRDTESGVIVAGAEPEATRRSVAAAFHRDGRLLVVQDDASLLAWDRGLGWTETCLPVGAAARAGRLLSIEGDLLRVRSFGAAWSINLEEGRIVGAHVLPEENELVGVSSHGAWSLGGDGNRRIALTDASGTELAAVESGHEREILAHALSPRGDLLALASADRMVSLWELPSLRRRQSLLAGDGAALCVTFSDDGRLLATASADGVLKLWEVGSPRLVARCEALPSLLAFGPSARLLVAAGTGRVHAWHIGGDDIPLEHAPGGHVRALAFSPDGTVMASGGDDGRLVVWDVASRARRLVIDAHDDQVRAVAFSPDGRSIVSASEDRGLAVWAVSDGSLRLRVTAHPQPLRALAIARDGAEIWTTATDGTACARDAVTGAERLRIAVGTASVPALALAPRDGLVVTGDREGFIRAWDAATGEPRARARVGGAVLALAVSPDGSRLACGDDAAEVSLWTLPDLQCVPALGRHGHWVAAVAFSPRGDALASGGLDTTRIWDLASGREAAVVDRDGLPVAGLAWSPDGSRLARGGLDGTIRIQSIAPSRADELSVGEVVAARRRGAAATSPPKE